jgi:hypothetical protein
MANGSQQRHAAAGARTWAAVWLQGGHCTKCLRLGQQAGELLLRRLLRKCANCCCCCCCCGTGCLLCNMHVPLRGAAMTEDAWQRRTPSTTMMMMMMMIGFTTHLSPTRHVANVTPTTAQTGSGGTVVQLVSKHSLGTHLFEAAVAARLTTHHMGRHMNAVPIKAEQRAP